MLTCIDVKFIFDSARLGLSRSANIVQIADVALRVVFLLFLVIISPSSGCSSYSWKEWNVRHFFFTTKTAQPCPQVFSVTLPVLTCSGLRFWRRFFIKHKILPNLVISNWLWWIMRVFLANQNWGNILNE